MESQNEVRPNYHHEPDKAALSMSDLVDAERIRVWEDDMGALHLSVDGEDFHGVRAVRAFPLSGKADYICFFDERGKEVVLVTHLRNLDEASRDALAKALERMYYVARITQIFKITEIVGISKWHVMTDRGYAIFEVVTRERIREISKGRYVMTDADGNRFEIPDISKLDPRSQSLVSTET